MAIEYSILKQEHADKASSFINASKLAEKLRMFLSEESTQKLIAEKHVLGAASTAIQEIVLTAATELGFENEKKGLFASYPVSSLRPDYFRRIGDTGILLEVERGKTTTNNMDLLDIWKCHICDHAKYLFLIVPQARPSANGSVMRHFAQVNKRLAPFFQKRNYINVEAVFIFGY